MKARSSLTGTLLCLGILLLVSTNAMATGAFARATGASCSKCHTANFPRLNAKGEKFMLNGFQIRKEAEDGGFSLDDDTPEAGKKPSSRKLTDVFAVTGTMEVVKNSSDTKAGGINESSSLTLMATGTLMEDVPVWAGVEFDGSAAELHRYMIGKTNIKGTTLLNMRVGTIDPTTWTSFYGHGANIDANVPGVMAYGGHHGDGDAIGIGYPEHRALEFYGYTDLFIWAAGLTSGSAHGHGGAHDDGHDAGVKTMEEHLFEAHGGPAPIVEPDPVEDTKLDYWGSARLNLFGDSSVSFLWYNANGSVELQSYTVAANIRLKKLDLKGQYSRDNTVVSGGHGDHPSAYTGQLEYLVDKTFMFATRYDSLSKGEQHKSMLTLAGIFKPAQHLKITAAYQLDLGHADSHGGGETGGHAHGGGGNTGTIKARFMF